MKQKPRILVIDDDPTILALLEAMLDEEGCEVVPVQDGEEAKRLLKEQNFSLMITDLLMKPVGGLELLAFAREECPGLPTILVTGHATIETAVSAMKEGAYDYVTKPFTFNEIIPVVRRAVDYAKVLTENKQLKAQLGNASSDKPIIAESAAMRDVCAMIERAAPTDASILILGESGTGKELVARAVHEASSRRDRAFVPVNCAALPENLLESELFGHVKGSFTGASADKEGLFETADGGTIFLDEISSMPLSLQGKLLRVLQEGEIRRVGGTKNQTVDVRVLSATHHDVEQMIKDGTFREDLFYRLSVIPISIEPLRRRKEDILPIAYHVIRHELGPSAAMPVMEAQAQLLLEQYSWPGNVRELENAMRHALAFSKDRIAVEHLPARLIQSSRGSPERASVQESSKEDEHLVIRPLKSVVREMERDYVGRVVAHFGGDKGQAAAALKISLATLYRKFPEYD